MQWNHASYSWIISHFTHGNSNYKPPTISLVNFTISFFSPWNIHMKESPKINIFHTLRCLPWKAPIKDSSWFWNQISKVSIPKAIHYQHSQEALPKAKTSLQSQNASVCSQKPLQEPKTFATTKQIKNAQNINILD